MKNNGTHGILDQFDIHPRGHSWFEGYSYLLQPAELESLCLWTYLATGESNDYAAAPFFQLAGGPHSL